MSDYVITGNAMTIGEKETAQELAKLKQQLEEAVGVINVFIDISPHYDDCNSEDPDDIEGCDCGREIDLKRARQFLAKYRGKND